MNHINEIAKAMDHPPMQAKGRILVVDEDVTDRGLLIKRLKNGAVPGNALVEWEDKTGTMRANVIDFIRGGDIKAFYLKTNDEVEIPHHRVKDGDWRIMY